MSAARKGAPFDATTAVEHIKGCTPKTKTFFIPPGGTVHDIADEVGHESMAWLQVFQALHFLEENPLVTPSKAAMDFVRVAKQLASTASLADSAEEAFRPLDDLLPNGQLGKVMRAGRKAGTVGPVRAWVRKHMMKNPSDTAAAAWAAFDRRPPKGHKVFENRLGKYIEAPGNTNTSYRQFANLVSLERPRK